MFQKIITTLALPLLMGTLFAPAQAQAEGIDCAKASDAVDKLVCASDVLKAEDGTMAQLFAVARINLFGNGPSREITEQQTWLKDRKDCLKPDTTESTKCLIEVYQSNNLALAYAAMPSSPDLALKVLKDQNVNVEPEFEALSIFASEPDGTDWSKPALAEKRARIMALASPVVEKLQNKASKDDSVLSVQNDLLEDGGVKSSEDILKSSKQFGAFIKASVFGLDDAAFLPCGYVATHPGLLEATTSYFGSTMDNNLIRSNCTTTAPPTPKMTALLKAINDGWPQCDGTIRFAAYRSFDVAVDEALAPTAQVIERYKMEKPTEAPAPLSGVSKSAIQGATVELTDYYVKYLKVTPGKASLFAKGKIAKLKELGQQCE